MVRRLLGPANTIDWPEPAAGVDLTLPDKLPSHIAPTNGYDYINKLERHLPTGVTSALRRRKQCSHSE